MYTAEIVTNFLLNLALKDGTSVSHNRLQTMLYYAQVWWLVIHEEPIIKDSLEYTKYGPIFMRPYFRFKNHTKCDLLSHYRPTETPSILEEAKQHLTVIWLVYGSIRRLPIGKDKDICSYNSPWHIIHKSKTKVGTISNQSLIDHYTYYQELRVMPNTMAIIDNKLVKINPKPEGPVERAKKQLTKIIIPNIRTNTAAKQFRIKPETCELIKFSLPLTSLQNYNKLEANRKNALKNSKKS